MTAGYLESGDFNGDGRQDLIILNLLGALPNGRAGQSYSKIIYASGGCLTIFGTPSSGGQFNVSIGISDNNALAGSSGKSLVPQIANALTQVLPLQVAFAPTAANVPVAGRISTCRRTSLKRGDRSADRRQRHDADGAQHDIRQFSIRSKPDKFML